ncbi:hypothetical protein RJ640_016854 [Escallonia rubra]|uniref:Uncharacterized protein n=1 Tax=Escallonia rubra TaxID=112253 RepID=A0AA88UQP5_9ASTE|nr:hypothetical protein RJ640_016854 [Escallonia rubra]
MGAMRNSPKAEMGAARNSPKPSPRRRSTTLQYLFDLDSRISGSNLTGNSSIVRRSPIEFENEELLSIISYCTFTYPFTDPTESASHQDLKRLKLVCLVSLFVLVFTRSVRTPKEGETVFVSAASDAVGQLVGQLAKLMVCNVVGSSGCKAKKFLRPTFYWWLNHEFDFLTVLTVTRYFPEGIAINFENVRGKTLDAVILNMRKNGRIALCGMISQYNLAEPEGVKILVPLIRKGITMNGFSSLDYLTRYSKFMDILLPFIREGKIVYIEDVAEGLEKTPAALVGLFSGRNIGKQVIVVSRE